VITQKQVFQTEDGKQFDSLQEAEHYELVRDIETALSAGCYRDEFEMTEAIAKLLETFNVTRKDDNAQLPPKV
jgi:hypothetical protein